jgi:hypothetical protein
MLLWVLVSPFLSCFFSFYGSISCRGSICAIAVFGSGFSGSACKLMLKA